MRVDVEDDWRRPARVVAVNASGACSGAERVLLALIGLALDDGIEVVVASPDGPLVAELPAGVRHVPLPPFGLGVPEGRAARAAAALGMVLRSRRAARALRAEVRAPGTHTVVNSLLALPAVRLARPAGAPTWLAHDVVTSRAQRAFVSFGLRGRRGLGRVVAVSEATAAPLRPLGCPVEVRPNGVPWPVAPVDLTRHDPPVIGSAALLVGWKGHQVLLEAVARVPAVHCELAGGHLPVDAPYVASLRARADAPDLAGRVRFLGHVDAEAAMRGWDVAVLASTSPEAGPLSVLEAMSLGLPVVATAHGGSAEYLARGGGVLVPPGDAAALAAGIETALDDAVRPDLADGGRRFVAEHHDLARTLPAQYRAVMSAPA